MSLTRNKVVHCPQCRQTSEFTIWDSINVFLDPEMRDELMKGNVFRWVCPHCGKLLSAHFDTLYWSMDILSVWCTIRIDY